MELLTKAELQLKIDEITERIKQGAVFIHPTDTIYGLGCNALDKEAVQKIRKLKQRPHLPLSIWAPSLEWIKENCLIDQKAKEWLAKLPGPYTLILKLKNKKALANNIAPGKETLGVRLPDHWFGEVVRALNVPFVTTSANRSGQPFMTSQRDLDPEIARGVEFTIYEGEKKLHPSKIVDLVSGKIKER